MLVTCRKIIFFFLLILNYTYCISQNVSSEEHTYDCYQFKRLTVPFNYGDSTLNKNGIPYFKKIEFNKKTHGFSDWYRILIKEPGIMSFKVSPINPLDSFEISFYIYKEADDFCTDVYEKKLHTGKSYLYSGIKTVEVSSSKETTLKTLKDQVYYLSVVSTTISDCGHKLRLNTGKDTLLLVSTYSPCARDTSTLVIKKVPKQSLTVKIKDDPLLNSTLKLKEIQNNSLRNIKCHVTDGKNNILLDSKLKIVEELTGKELRIESENTGEFNFNIEQNKNYKVLCSSLGYKDFDYSVDISKFLSQTNSYNIILNLIKAGNNFVMKNIYFHANTYALKKESESELAALLQYMNAHSTAKIEIQGYTNGDRRIKKNKAYKNLSEEWNFQGSAKSLSTFRAEAIKQYLLMQDINPKRITTKGFGGYKMIVKNPKSLKDIQKNIRVEVLIVEN